MGCCRSRGTLSIRALPCVTSCMFQTARSRYVQSEFPPRNTSRYQAGWNRGQALANSVAAQSVEASMCGSLSLRCLHRILRPERGVFDDRVAIKQRGCSAGCAVSTCSAFSMSDGMIGLDEKAITSAAPPRNAALHSAIMQADKHDRTSTHGSSRRLLRSIPRTLAASSFSGNF
jgi:hypothetical protein